MDENALYDRIKVMLQGDLEALDPICVALQDYLLRERETGGHVMPNRVIALACVDLVKEWQQMVLSRD